jgi:hypothetical protein
MKTGFKRALARRGGYALMLVLFFGGISLMALSGALQWCSSTARTTERNNRYFSAVSAAEAATEKVLTTISRDYLNSGEANVFANLDTYRSYVPTPAENGYWGNFVFTDAQGHESRTYVTRTAAAAYVPLQSQYEGLYGLAANYRIISNARDAQLRPALTGAVKQDIQVAAIPIFQFAIFYTMDLEMNPGPAMNVTGRVHSNASIYLQPQASLIFQDHVTAANKINLTKSALDPSSRTPGSIVFQNEHDSGVHSLNLPIGTNNSPASVRNVVEIPPAGEPINSAMGLQRYYNKADLIVLVSNTTVTVKSGSYNNFGTTIPWTNVTGFIKTNVSFYNKREGKTVVTTEIDVSKLITWSSTNTQGRGMLASLDRDVNQIYIADNRTQSATTESGVRLINGDTLPSRGLTIATPNPAYVKGDFNAPLVDRGTTNTTRTKPASIIADAVTVLSSSWTDANSALSISSRNAINTTVNAAFLAGITQSNGLFYSGGVENLPRFLENWSAATMTYNGSMVVMFPSVYAKGAWGSSDVYSPPNRQWAFDRNFLDATKLPPGTPMVLTTIRSKWAMVAADTIL